MNITKQLLAVSLVFFSTIVFSAEPPNWVIIKTDLYPNPTISVDKANFSKIGDIADVTVRTEFPVPMWLMHDDLKGNKHHVTQQVKIAIEYATYDCKLEQFIVRREEFFNDQNRLIFATTAKEDDLKIVKQRTLSGLIFNFACRKDVTPKQNI